MWYIIFEDDAKPLGNIETFYDDVLKVIRSLPQNAFIVDMCIYGSSCEARYWVTSPHLNKNLGRGMSRSNLCYALTPEGAKYLMEVVEKSHFAKHVDTVYKLATTNHPRTYFFNLVTQHGTDSDREALDHKK